MSKIKDVLKKDLGYIATGIKDGTLVGVGAYIIYGLKFIWNSYGTDTYYGSHGNLTSHIYEHNSFTVPSWIGWVAAIYGLADFGLKCYNIRKYNSLENKIEENENKIKENEKATQGMATALSSVIPEDKRKDIIKKYFSKKTNGGKKQ